MAELEVVDGNNDLTVDSLQSQQFVQTMSPSYANVRYIEGLATYLDGPINENVASPFGERFENNLT